jgi:hypothetical protein
MVPMKHRVNGLRELIVVGFVDAICIYPKVLPAVASGHFSAELDLVIAGLVLACTINYIPEGDLLCSLCV